MNPLSMNDSLNSYGGALSGGLGGGAGSILNDVGQTYLQDHLNRKENRSQRKYLKEMSNTAHRREVDDLIAAGLNPILTATGGGGASTPSMSASSVSRGTANPVSSALEARRYNTERLLAEKQMQKISADTVLSKAQAIKSGQDARLTSYQADILKPKAAVLSPAGDAVNVLMDTLKGKVNENSLTSAFSWFGNKIQQGFSWLNGKSSRSGVQGGSSASAPFATSSNHYSELEDAFLQMWRDGTAIGSNPKTEEARKAYINAYERYTREKAKNR